MAIYDTLAFARQEAAKCMSCGNCQEVCPLYLAQRTEASVARGKVRLAQAAMAGQLDWNGPLADKMALCLTCKACNEKCPCGVQVDKIVLSMRAALVRDRGLHPLKKAIFTVMDQDRLFDVGLQLGSRLQGLAFKKQTELDGMKPRFPFGLDMRRVIPTIADKPFRSRVPEVIRPGGKPVLTVALFTGCSGNYLYPEVLESLVTVLSHYQVRLIVPKAQHCCGLPILTHGDAVTAREMAASHVGLFAGLRADYLLTVCGSCGCAFQHHYPDLLADDAELGPLARQLAAKVMDWSDFVVNILRPDFTALSPLPVTVTYHDPCHLKRGMGVSAAPRAILEAIPGLTLREMANADRCCGSAGSFSLTHYELSMAVQRQKWQAIQETEADWVVTGCGACMMQLADGQNRFGGPKPIRHTVQVLAAALGGQ